MSASKAVRLVRSCAMCDGSVSIEAIETQRATECRRCKRRLHLKCAIWLSIPPGFQPRDSNTRSLGYYGEKVEHCRRCAAELVIAYDDIEESSQGKACTCSGAESGADHSRWCLMVENPL